MDGSRFNFLFLAFSSRYHVRRASFRFGLIKSTKPAEYPRSAALPAGSWPFRDRDIAARDSPDRTYRGFLFRTRFGVGDDGRTFR